jgi:hypothetical protein
MRGSGLTGPAGKDPQSGRWRVAVLALVFALVSHGCFIVSTSLTRSPL